ncbi:putative B3 domain-containing protein Os03g0621600 [Chenopodium quinoa]|uniref:putative B3 domain-containing protein Os03g0621600 n=1 Tax=Chenopodium quinoa TaxID=63459 RepID=UPI000B77834A|nr:putative B3 domain-containing protein Os03g0621600 [Chenopodium quinoa]
MGTHFYKIIVSPSTQCHTLRIPEKYVHKYKEVQLAKDYVNLRVADGRVWRVELLKQCDKVWFKKGWEVFVKSYSLKFGDFLLFRYDEANFEFCVTIFNMSGCEIDYDQVFQNRIIDLAQQVQEISSCDNDDDLSLEAKDIHIIDETETETTSVMHNIEAFEPQKPHFKVVMHHNNVSNQYRLSFPINHVRENLTIVSKKLKLILKRSVDEKWYNLRLNVYAKNNLAQVGSAGWGNFVRDNELHIGDACVFELVDPRTAMYKVTIIRSS